MLDYERALSEDANNPGIWLSTAVVMLNRVPPNHPAEAWENGCRCFALSMLTRPRVRGKQPRTAQTLQAAIDAMERLVTCSGAPRARLLHALLLAVQGDETASEAQMIEVLRVEPELVDRYMRQTDRPLLVDTFPESVLTPALGPHRTLATESSAARASTDMS